jgi:hypothetical protein
MPPSSLEISDLPELNQASLLLGLSGWMNGGEASLGTIKYLSEKFKAQEIAAINPEGFYIYNFPGSMEMSAMFRPHTKIEYGLIKEYEPPKSVFLCNPEKELVFFSGKEPHLGWQEYENCIFYVCKKLSVSRVFFIGSVAGITPHTREPRITKLNIKPVNYEGPASIVTSFTVRAAREGINFLTLVAEIPPYVNGYNPRCVVTMIKCLARILDLQIDIDDLRKESDKFEKKLDKVIEEQEILAEKVKELENNYDKEAFDREMSGLKNWFGDHGISVD